MKLQVPKPVKRSQSGCTGFDNALDKQLIEQVFGASTSQNSKKTESLKLRYFLLLHRLLIAHLDCFQHIPEPCSPRASISSAKGFRHAGYRQQELPSGSIA